MRRKLSDAPVIWSGRGNGRSWRCGLLREGSTRLRTADVSSSHIVLPRMYAASSQLRVDCACARRASQMAVRRETLSPYFSLPRQHFFGAWVQPVPWNRYVKCRDTSSEAALHLLLCFVLSLSPGTPCRAARACKRRPLRASPASFLAWMSSSAPPHRLSPAGSSCPPWRLPSVPPVVLVPTPPVPSPARISAPQLQESHPMDLRPDGQGWPCAPLDILLRETGATRRQEAQETARPSPRSPGGASQGACPDTLSPAPMRTQNVLSPKPRALALTPTLLTPTPLLSSRAVPPPRRGPCT